MKIKYCIAIIASIYASEVEPQKSAFIPYRESLKIYVHPLHLEEAPPICHWCESPPAATKKHPKVVFNKKEKKWERLTMQEFLEHQKNLIQDENAKK